MTLPTPPRSRAYRPGALAHTQPPIVARRPYTPGAAHHGAISPLAHVPQQVRARLRAGMQRLPKVCFQWECWLIAIIAVALRIPPLLRSPFTSDDALLFLEAGRASQAHLAPITGIYSSLLAMNMPFYTWLLLPFVHHPFGMAIVTGLANVIAVIALYLVGERYLGRSAGLIAGLLFATATYPVWMSLVVWQQTLIPVLLIAYFWTLLAGIVEGKRSWAPLNTLLLTMLIQIYPLTATLLPLTLLGVVFTWRQLRRRDVALAAIGPLALCIPTAIFEYASGGYDIRIYTRYLHAPSHIDGQALDRLRQAIGVLPGDYLGGSTLYSSVAPALSAAGIVLLVLWAGSAIWLFCTLVSPRLAALSRFARWSTPSYIPNAAQTSHATPAAFGQFTPTVTRWWAPTFLTDPAWRLRLMLLLWQPIFLAVTIHHSSPIYIHYMFIMLPIIYLTIGWALAQIPLLIGALGAGVVGAIQAFVTACFVLTIVTGQAAGSSWGGIPITTYAQALSATNAVVAQAHGQAAYFAADAADPYTGLYWAQRQTQLDAQGDGRGITWTSLTSEACALTPPKSAGPAGVLVVGAPGPALTDLLASAGSQVVRRLPMARGVTDPVYQIAANTAGLNAPGVVINGDLRLDSSRLALAGAGLPERIVSFWTSLDATPPGPAADQYTFQFQLSGPNRPYTQVPLTCAPSAWTVGEGVVLSLPLPSDYTGASIPNVSVQILRTTHSWYHPQVGPLTFETAQETYHDAILLPVGARRTSGFTNLSSLSTQEITAATFPLYYQK